MANLPTMLDFGSVHHRPEARKIYEEVNYYHWRGLWRHWPDASAWPTNPYRVPMPRVLSCNSWVHFGGPLYGLFSRVKVDPAIRADWGIRIYVDPDQRADARPLWPLTLNAQHPDQARGTLLLARTNGDHARYIDLDTPEVGPFLVDDVYLDALAEALRLLQPDDAEIAQARIGNSYFQSLQTPGQAVVVPSRTVLHTQPPVEPAPTVIAGQVRVLDAPGGAYSPTGPVPVATHDLSLGQAVFARIAARLDDARQRLAQQDDRLMDERTKLDTRFAVRRRIVVQEADMVTLRAETRAWALDRVVELEHGDTVQVPDAPGNLAATDRTAILHSLRQHLTLDARLLQREFEAYTADLQDVCVLAGGHFSEDARGSGIQMLDRCRQCGLEAPASPLQTPLDTSGFLN